MVKTTVYLDDDVMASLRVISKRRAKPQAQLIREAVRRFTSDEPPVLPAGLGAFDSGMSDTTARRKDILKDAALAKKWR